MLDDHDLHENEIGNVECDIDATSNASEETTEKVAVLLSSGDIQQGSTCCLNDSGIDRLCEALSTTVQLQSPSKGDEVYSQRFICDLGYGLPNESRPRKEKILAIARQLTNFLVWRHQGQVQVQLPTAHLLIILGISAHSEKQANASSFSNNSREGETIDTRSQETLLVQDALFERMREIWAQHESIEAPFPDHTVSFVHDSLDEFLQTSCEVHNRTSGRNSYDNRDVVYLSPDATTTLDIATLPPKNIIIGLLIDRRSIQVNRSYMRAQDIQVPSARLSFDCVAPLSIDKNEPLNVDCVLEVMQQWSWNVFLAGRTIQRDTQTAASDVGSGFPSTPRVDSPTMKAAFDRAVIQAMQHHWSRHPRRPLHKTPSKNR
jgi:hypothetical protein